MLARPLVPGRIYYVRSARYTGAVFAANACAALQQVAL